MPNNRLFYATYGLGFDLIGATGSFVGVSGVQSVGINTTFNLDSVFQLGELDVLDQPEGIPNVELSVEQALGKWPLTCVVATRAVASASTLIARFANSQCNAAISYYADTSIAATGVTKEELVFMSGMYVSNVSFSFPVEGNATHSCTLVGNHKDWSTLALGAFPNTNFGSVATGVSLRQNLTSATLPSNLADGNSLSTNRIQSINISSDFGRPEIFQLGTKAPYCRYMEFPTEVTCAIEMIELKGDLITANPTGTNSVDMSISLTFDTALVLDLGSSNRLMSVTSQGGDTSGGNRTTTYNYRNYNTLTITDPVYA